MRPSVSALVGSSVLGVALCTAAPALASDQPGAAAFQWLEELSTPTPNHTTDAGFTIPTANITRGDGTLSQIRGTLVQVTGATTNDLDVDIFCIRISDPANFSAVVSGGFGADTNLSLFSPTGAAIVFNDNRTDSGTATHARLSNAIVGSLPVGDYFLAISRNDGTRNQRPIDAMGNLIFSGPPNGTAASGADPARRVEVGPTVPGTLLAGWESNPPGGFAVFNLNYTITLTGTTFSTLPAPGSAALLGVGALAAARRRRR
jgi:hypothetical protein